MELEANPGRLRLGEALAGSALGGLEPGQLDHAGCPAQDELDGDLDLAKGDRERIRVADGRDPIADVMHITKRRPWHQEGMAAKASIDAQHVLNRHRLEVRRSDRLGQRLDELAVVQLGVEPAAARSVSWSPCSTMRHCP